MVWKRLPLAASTAMSKKPSVATGAKSFCASNGSDWNRPALTAVPLLIRSRT
jgi:hypothetical protein